MSDEFKLEPSGTIPWGRGGRRPGAGRPLGRKKTLRERMIETNFRMARGEWPQIFDGLLRLAGGVTGPNPTPLEFRAACWLGERFFPEPRGAPVAVNIAQLGGAALVEAVQAGDLLPSDAAALIRAKPHVGLLPAGDTGSGSTSARKVLEERLVKAVEGRSGASQNGGYNPASRDESPEQSSSNEPNCDTLETRVQQAFDAGDAAALEALADELEK